MNNRLGNIKVLRQALSKKVNFSNLHWVKFLIKGWIKMKTKKRLLQRLKNIEGKNEEQLKAIEDPKEVQDRAFSKNKIKPPFLKSIYNQELKDGNINNDEAKKIFETLKDMEGSKIDYPKLAYKSGDNQYFDFKKNWTVIQYLSEVDK